MAISQKWIDIQAADGGTFRAYVAVPESGRGPGLLLLQEAFGVNEHMRHLANLHAEEGWTVIVPDLFWRMEPGISLGYSEADVARAIGYYQRFDVDLAVRDSGAALTALRALPECEGKAGVLGYCVGGLLAYLVAARCDDVACAVSYYGVNIEGHLDEAARIRCPMILHCAGSDQFVPSAAVTAIKAVFAGREDVKVYDYPGAEHGFDNPNRAVFERSAHWMAKSRTLRLLRDSLGPVYDLASLWEYHLYTEFADRNVDDSMATMTDDPYVLVVPTVTGGTGKPNLHKWYSNHFHFQNPPNSKLIPVSRTVGTDRLVDEFIFCFTHDRVMDWMLPGVPPTGRYIEVPMLGVINFRGPKLYHEHIWWDQATVLVQAGLLDPTGLPVTGIEQAKAMLDEHLPRNRLIPGWQPVT